MATKILLQDSESKLLLESLDGWTSNATRALSLYNTVDATLFCIMNELRGVRVVVEKRDVKPSSQASNVPQTDSITHFPFC